MNNSRPIFASEWIDNYEVLQLSDASAGSGFRWRDNALTWQTGIILPASNSGAGSKAPSCPITVKTARVTDEEGQIVYSMADGRSLQGPSTTKKSSKLDFVLDVLFASGGSKPSSSGKAPKTVEKRVVFTISVEHVGKPEDSKKNIEKRPHPVLLLGPPAADHWSKTLPAIGTLPSYSFDDCDTFAVAETFQGKPELSFLPSGIYFTLRFTYSHRSPNSRFTKRCRLNLLYGGRVCDNLEIALSNGLYDENKTHVSVRKLRQDRNDALHEAISESGICRVDAVGIVNVSKDVKASATSANRRRAMRKTRKNEGGGGGAGYRPAIKKEIDGSDEDSNVDTTVDEDSSSMPPPSSSSQNAFSRHADSYRLIKGHMQSSSSQEEEKRIPMPPSPLSSRGNSFNTSVFCGSFGSSTALPYITGNIPMPSGDYGDSFVGNLPGASFGNLLPGTSFAGSLPGVQFTVATNGSFVQQTLPQSPSSLCSDDFGDDTSESLNLRQFIKEQAAAIKALERRVKDLEKEKLRVTASLVGVQQDSEMERDAIQQQKQMLQTKVDKLQKILDPAAFVNVPKKSQLSRLQKKSVSESVLQLESSGELPKIGEKRDREEDGNQAKKKVQRGTQDSNALKRTKNFNGSGNPPVPPGIAGSKDMGERRTSARKGRVDSSRITEMEEGGGAALLLLSGEADLEPLSQEYKMGLRS